MDHSTNNKAMPRHNLTRAQTEALDAAHKPAMSQGSPFDELVAHRIEALAQQHGVKVGPGLDGLWAAYTAGLRDETAQPHRVEGVAKQLDLDHTPALDAAYAAGLREASVTLGALARARDE